MDDNNPQGTVDEAQDTELTLDEAAERLEGLLPEDEEQEDSAAEEADEGETEDPDDEAAESPTESRKWKVKVDGEEVEVDEAELLSGYSRHSDYTRKTQELAKQRQTAEQELTQARAERQQYAQALQQIAQKLQDEPAVDWDHLYKTDPIEYLRQRDQQRERQDQRRAVEAEQMRLYQTQQTEQQKAMQHRLSEEAKLLASAIPQWKDDGKAKAERDAIRSYAVDKLGFDVTDVSGITDHRVVVALRKAWLYDTAMSKKSQLAQPAPKQKSANPTAAQPQRMRASGLKERLRKTGSEDDAAAYFATILS